MSKLISVIIPVKNGEKYLEEAIRGIQNQDMNTEIIVVNDASTDSTPDIASKLGCLVLTHEQCRGQVAGKNTGLRAANGEYILFHDADDVMRQGTLAKLYDELKTNADASAAMGQVKDFISPDLTDPEKKSCSIRNDAYFGLFTGAVLIRKSVFDVVGLFDERLHAGEIIELQTKMNQHGLVIKKLDFIAADRRIHNSNFGETNRTIEYQNYASILRERLHGKKL